MSIAEYVFAAIGVLVIAGGFAYGIHDTYFYKQDTDSSNTKKHQD